MKPFAIIDVSEYSGRARKLMDKAGYLKTEIYWGKDGQSYQIAIFADGTKIDSRQKGFLKKFHKKCYNE